MSTHLRSTKIKVNKGDTKNVSHLFPVKGRVQCSSSLCPPPFAVCSIVTTTWIIKMEIRTFKIKKKRSNAANLGVGSSHQIHRTPHSFHHLPRDHPVGQITATRYLHLYNIHIHRAKLSQNVSKMNFHLHGAQDSESNMSTSNHSKTLFTREEGAAWNCSHRLLPRVDQVRINLRKSINNVLDFFCTKRN